MKVQLERPIAYTIAGSAYLGPYEIEPLRVKESANAWWMERGKLYALLFAFRLGLDIKNACGMAMISPDQYKYFCKVHPEFSLTKARIEAEPIFQAHYVLDKALYNDRTASDRRLAGRIAMWKLARYRPSIYGSATERIFWAKLALERMNNDQDTKDHLKENIDIARELLEGGDSILEPQYNGKPVKWVPGHWEEA